MDIALIIFGIFFIIIWLWLTILGCIAAKFDTTLTAFQRRSQIVIVLLVPFFGAAVILHLVNQHSPEVIPHAWIPWPLKSLIFGKNRSKYKDRNNNEDPGIDLAINDHQHDNASIGGSDIGGGSD